MPILYSLLVKLTAANFEGARTLPQYTNVKFRHDYNSGEPALDSFGLSLIASACAWHIMFVCYTCILCL